MSCTIEIAADTQVQIPSYVTDLNTFRRWAHSEEFPERGEISYIAGEIWVDMNAEEIESHNKVKRDVGGGLWLFLENTDAGELLVDGALLVNEEADLATEPDLIFCSWESLRSGRVAYAEWVEGSERLVEVRGTPDIAIEVVSRYSLPKDLRKLPVAYFKAGIPEYWLIDARGEEIRFMLQVRGEAAYEPVQPDADGYSYSPVLKQAFRVTRERNPVGRFRYRLQWRSE